MSVPRTPSASWTRPRQGTSASKKLLHNLRSKLPDEEVNFAVEDALVDANLKDAEQVDFEGFMKLVTIGSHASLDGLENYPDRLVITSQELQGRHPGRERQRGMHGGVT